MHRGRRKVDIAVRLFIMPTIALLLIAGAASGQVPSSVVLRSPVAPEDLADVILVLRPHVTLPLHVPAQAERLVEGDIVRVEKGIVPHMIVHTANAFVAPLRAGVPVKLLLK